MKIALAQIESKLGDLKQNIDTHLRYCEEAKKSKCDLIVFPELSLTGYSLKDLNYEVALNPKESRLLNPLKRISSEIGIICGFVEEDDNYAVYNAAAFIYKGEIKHIHRKIYPPTYGIFEEMRYFSKGTFCDPFLMEEVNLGVLICEDMWHISLPYLLAIKGAKIIIGLAASPTKMSVKSDSFRNYEINSEHHKTFARLLSVYMIFCNRVGYEDGINFWGGSEIVDPFGNVVAKGELFSEELIFADIELTEVQRARRFARHFLDEDLNIINRNLPKL
jgi:NAD+ synthase (glutamine-hydrolysing)